MSIFSVFKDVYCLTANGREDIYKNALGELNSIGFDEPIQKFNGTENDDKVLSEKPQLKRGSYLLKSVCHKEIWKKSLEKNSENTLIIEDDICLDNWNPDIFEKALEDLPEDWEFLFLGYNCKAKNDEVEKISDSLLRFKKGSFIRSTHFYMINGNILEEIIDKYNPFDLKKDKSSKDYMIDVWIPNNYSVYGAYPILSTEQQEIEERRSGIKNKKDLFNRNLKSRKWNHGNLK